MVILLTPTSAPSIEQDLVRANDGAGECNPSRIARPAARLVAVQFAAVVPIGTYHDRMCLHLPVSDRRRFGELMGAREPR